MAQLSNSTRVKIQKEWKDKHSYDKSLNEKQARALQRWAYNNGLYTNASSNANIDGKWGEYSARRAKTVGMDIAKDYNSFTNKLGDTYIWDPKQGDYIKVTQKNAPLKAVSRVKPVGEYDASKHAVIKPNPLMGLGFADHGFSQAEKQKRGFDWRLKVPQNVAEWPQARLKWYYQWLNQTGREDNPQNLQDYVDFTNNFHVQNDNQMEAAAQMADGITDAMGYLATVNLGPKMGRAESKFIAPASNATEHVLDIASNPKVIVNEYIPNLEYHLLNGVEDAIHGIKGFPGAVRTLGTDLASEAGSAVSKGVKTVLNAGKAATNAGKKAVQTVKQAGTTIANRGKDAVANARQSMNLAVAKVGDIPQYIRTAGQNAGQRVRTGMEYLGRYSQPRKAPSTIKWRAPQVASELPSGENYYGLEFIDTFRRGGRFQQGGTIDDLIVALIQAAQQGDLQAILQLTQIELAAKSGDLQAIQIMQKIQQIMLQAQKAALGAKLQYIKRIKLECPEGYEVNYFKKGGQLCKECVAKNDPVRAFKEKCGGKAKKNEKADQYSLKLEKRVRPMEKVLTKPDIPEK